jgi:hypothetical protein
MTELSATVRKECVDILRALHKWTWKDAVDGRQQFGGEAIFVEATEAGGDARSAGGASEMLRSAVLRAAYRHVGDYIEVEEAFGKGFGQLPKQETLQIQEHHENHRGLWLHFTRRTRAQTDLPMVRASCDQLAELLQEAPEVMAKDMLANLGADFNAALDALTATTGAVASGSQRSETAANAGEIVKYEQLVSLWTQIILAWRNALNAGTIHVVFDRSELTDAFGYSSPSDATPKTLMTGDAGVFTKGQRIVVNLDALKQADVVVTLAHELAHALGFNPKGMDAHGHFTEIAKYKEAEKTYGSKLLFDAYYIESIVRRLTSS